MAAAKGAGVPLDALPFAPGSGKFPKASGFSQFSCELGNALYVAQHGLTRRPMEVLERFEFQIGSCVLERLELCLRRRRMKPLRIVANTTLFLSPGLKSRVEEILGLARDDLVKSAQILVANAIVSGSDVYDRSSWTPSWAEAFAPLSDNSLSADELAQVLDFAAAVQTTRRPVYSSGVGCWVQ